MSITGSATLKEQISAALIGTRGVSTERAPLATRVKYSLVVRRFEFLPVILTVAIMPAVLGASSWTELASLNAVVAVVWAVAGLQIGNMTNALADREVDALYKSRMSEAIYGLGVSRVVGHIAVSTAINLGLAAFLAVRTQHWDLLLIAVVAGLIGFQYSLPPLQLKSAGSWQLFVLQLDLVFLPGLFILRSYGHDLEWGTVVTVAGFAMVLVSLFVTSHAEDYLEDGQFGLRTYPRALGLTNAMYVQSTMLFVGSLLVIGSVFATFGVNWAFIAYVIAWLESQRFLFTVVRDVRGAPLDSAIAALHEKSLIGPYHAALMGWTTVVLAVFVLIGR